MSDKLAGATEDNVLTLICFNDTHCMRLRIDLNVELFSTRTYRLIAETAYDYIDKYGAAPKGHIRDLLEDQLRGKSGELLMKILDAMDKLAPDLQPDYVLDDLDAFIEKRRMGMAISDAADALDRGDLDKAREALHASTALLSKRRPGIWLSDTDAMLRFLNKRDEDQFTSGIEALDVRGITPARKTLLMAIGSKGIGKSWLMIQIAKRNLMLRRSVLHISLENSDELTAQRYVQSLYAMTDKASTTVRVPFFKKDSLGRFLSIEHDTQTPEVLNLASRSTVAKKLQQWKRRARLLISEFPTGGLTVPELAAYLDYLDKAENFRPDLLVLDQAFNMRFNAKDIRASRGQTIVDLRGLAVLRNMAVVTCWQGNRATDNVKTVTSGHVAEDWSVVGTADTVITISRTQAETDAGLARILVDKARTARDKFIVMITQSYETGQFALDSTYFSKFVEAEASALTGVEAED